jgi:rod shape-determining protein MreC
MGMLENGVLAGFITEVSVNHSLVLPVIHLSTTWSVRLGYGGAVGILTWSGESIEYATLTDIPLSEHILPGDSVITSGFQGTFPSGILVGKVEELIVTEADEFQSVTIKLSADYKRIHYVEFLSKVGTLEIDSLLSTSSL